MSVQDCYKKGIPVDSNNDLRKSEVILDDNLRQKKSEGPKAGEFNTSKEWFDKFRKRLSFQNVKITGEAASSDQMAADGFPDAIKIITEEKGYRPEQAFIIDEVPYSGKKIPQRTFISKEEKLSNSLSSQVNGVFFKVTMFPILYYGFDCNTVCHKYYIIIHSLLYKLGYHEAIILH